MFIGRRIIGLLLIAVIVGLWGYSLHGQPDVIRLHVIANSDSPQDQALKLKVRDEVLKTLGPVLQTASSHREAEALVRAHLEEVRESANRLIAATGGCSITQVRVEFGQYLFPAKSYGNLLLPAGRYKALRVVLGEGKGQNWWCVLFPPLCYVGTTGTYTLDPEKVEVLRRSIEMAYSGRTSPRKISPPEEMPLPEVKLAILELLKRNDLGVHLSKLMNLLSRFHL